METLVPGVATEHPELRPGRPTLVLSERARRREWLMRSCGPPP